MRSVDATILLVDPELEQLAGELARCKGVPAVLFLGPTRGGEDLVACAARHSGLRVPSASQPADDWCLRMTGGSTGIPKIIGVSFLQGHLAIVKRAAVLREQVGDDAQLRFLACASVAHSAGVQADATLLAGGHERQQDYTELAGLLTQRGVEVLVCLPVTGDRLATLAYSAAPGVEVLEAPTLDAALGALALRRARIDTVILSPGAPSYGQLEAPGKPFANFEERGAAFIRLAKNYFGGA